LQYSRIAETFPIAKSNIVPQATPSAQAFHQHSKAHLVENGLGLDIGDDAFSDEIRLQPVLIALVGCVAAVGTMWAAS
jgi:hypothetical protein